MAFNGSGTFVRSHNWVTDKTNTVAVTASRMDTECDGFATGLSTALCKDGQQTATARIPFALGVSSMDGTAASVSYAHISDLNTGLYFPTSDEWGLSAGGVGTLTSTATTVTCPVILNVTGASTVTGAFIGSSTANIVGNFSVATNKFTVAAASGNTVVAGTLAVTGVTTQTGTLNTQAINATAITGTTYVGSSTISGTNITASGALSGATAAGSMLASQAEQETGTAANKLVTPSVQHFHPGAAKAWGKFAGATGTLAVGYNATTVRDSEGDYTVTIGNDFSTADYVIVLSFLFNTANCIVRVATQAAGSFTIKAVDTTNADVDPTAIFFACYGDL